MFREQKIKLLVCSVLAILLIAQLLPGGLMAAPAESSDTGLPVQVETQSAIVMDRLTGLILYEKDSHTKLYPASTTKVMTLLLTVEAVEAGRADWTDLVTATSLAQSYGGSQIYLAEGEVLPLKELALGVALASGNDAAVAIAEYLGGSHEGFVQMMNQRAAELGMKGTHFANANGLHDDQHYTTAFDLALLGRKAAEYPALLEITGTKHYQIRQDTSKPFNFDNKNKLLWQFEGAQGLKTGWTEEAGYCLVAVAERNGLQLVSVVLNNPKPKGHVEDSKKLLSWAYHAYTSYKPSPQELPQVIIQVNRGKADSVKGVLPGQWGIPLLKGQSASLQYAWEGPIEVKAPIYAGQELG